jgi:RND family efflux transporter MFP subunit
MFRNLTAIVITTFLLSACERKPEGKGAATQRALPNVTVSTTPARLASVQRSVDVFGTLYAEEETVVSCKVPGRIIALYKDVGDTVAPGEALVQLGPNDYQLAVNKAGLAMKESLAKLGLTDLPPIDYDVTKVPAVVKAKLEADNALAKFNRGKKLFEATPPLLSEQEFADLDTALRVARSNYDVELLAAKAIVAEAHSRKGDLDIAKQRLTDATTRAPATPESKDQRVNNGEPAKEPHSFIVSQRLVNVGELVREITPAYRLVDINPIKLRTQAPERYVAHIKQGQTVKARIEAYPDVVFTGKVSRVNPQIDPDSRSFSMEIIIPNDDMRLRPGAFCRAAVETRVEDKVVLAPRSAVVTFAGVNRAFKVLDGKAVEAAITLGDAVQTIDGVEYVEIAKGLKGDEQLVTTGNSKLVNGNPVTVKAATTTQSAK